MIKKPLIMTCDNFDWDILNLLQENGRLSYAEIGRIIGLSPSATAERVQRLEDEEIIEKHTSNVNYSKVGFTLSAYINMDFRSSNYSVFIDRLSEFPEIVHCSRVTGDNCLIMKVVLVNNSHLANIVDRLCKYGNPYTSVVLSDVVSNGKVSNPKDLFVEK